MDKKRHVRRWVIWSLAAFFYFYEYFIRVAPSVMVPELMHTFRLDASSVGILSAFYFYAYAPMQIPVGMMMDRYGARRLLTFGALACGIGSFLLGMAPVLWIAEFGRFLTGMGSAFAFLGLVFVSSHWFPLEKLAFLVSVGNSIGMMGGVIGLGPLSYSVLEFGWRGTNFGLGVVGIALGLAILFIVRNGPSSQTPLRKTSKVLTNFVDVLKNGNSWLNIFSSFFFYIPIASFAGLWAVPFIEKVYGTSRSVAGFAASMMYLGIVISAPLLGRWSDRVGRRKPFVLVTSILGAFFLVIVIRMSHFPLWVTFVCLFLAGVCCSGQLLNYCLAVELNKKGAKASSVALLNCISFVGAIIVQPLVGYLMDLLWNGKMHGHLRVYSKADYHLVMLVFPIAHLLAFIVTLFLHEKKHHSHETVLTPR